MPLWRRAEKQFLHSEQNHIVARVDNMLGHVDENEQVLLEQVALLTNPMERFEVRMHVTAINDNPVEQADNMQNRSININAMEQGQEEVPAPVVEPIVNRSLIIDGDVEMPMLANVDQPMACFFLNKIIFLLTMKRSYSIFCLLVRSLRYLLLEMLLIQEQML